MPRRHLLLIPLTLLAACTWAAQPMTPEGLDEAVLRADLFAFADDSMRGRRAGTEGGTKASRFLAARLARAGLEPAGDNATFYQQIPLVRAVADTTATLTLTSRCTDGGCTSETLRWGTDFVVATTRWRISPLENTPVVFLGTAATDTAGWPSREALRGHVVLFDRSGQTSAAAGTAPAQYLSHVAAVMVVTDIGSLPAAVRTPATALAAHTLPQEMPSGVPTIYVSPRVAGAVLGEERATARVGLTGSTVTGTVRMIETPAPAENVVAVLRGRDPVLRNEYVVISAHHDHVGTRASPLDHDSLRAVLLAAEALGHQRGRRLSAAERAQMSVSMDTLARSGPVRMDSVYNGADDDGSGSIIVLALAEYMARAAEKPRRSVLFIWHHAEESGLLGSRHFSDHPTVPRERIVAAVNLDMVGRGRAADIPGGGPRYLQVIGSRRISRQLGELVEAVNQRLWEPMQLDYSMDAEGHPERIYCRSDHANYARYGIPIVFFTTGLHADYHQLTDEPQYIDYGKMRRVGALAGTLALDIANADARPRIDHPVTNPFAPCVQ